jgi:hypothetical protein
MKYNFEDIRLGYEAYCSVKDRLAQCTEDYVREFVGDNEYVIDGDELGTNKFCGRVLSIKQENGELLVNAEHEKDIPFRSLSVTDKVFIAKELADCFDEEVEPVPLKSKILEENGIELCDNRPQHYDLAKYFKSKE